MFRQQSTNLKHWIMSREVPAFYQAMTEWSGCLCTFNTPNTTPQYISKSVKHQHWTREHCIKKVWKSLSNGTNWRTWNTWGIELAEITLDLGKCYLVKIVEKMGTLILSHLYKVTISIWDNQNSKPGLTDSKAYIQKVHFYFIVKIVLKRLKILRIKERPRRKINLITNTLRRFKFKK